MAPMKARGNEDMVSTHQSLHTIMVNTGLCPHLQKLENECYDALEEFIIEENVIVQLNAPHCHQ
jgi:hypothetical protein